MAAITQKLHEYSSASILASLHLSHSLLLSSLHTPLHASHPFPKSSCLFRLGLVHKSSLLFSLRSSWLWSCPRQHIHYICIYIIDTCMYVYVYLLYVDFTHRPSSLISLAAFGFHCNVFCFFFSLQVAVSFRLVTATSLSLSLSLITGYLLPNPSILSPVPFDRPLGKSFEVLFMCWSLGCWYFIASLAAVSLRFWPFNWACTSSHEAECGMWQHKTQFPQRNRG